MLFNWNNTVVDYPDHLEDNSVALWECWLEGKRDQAQYFTAPTAIQFDLPGAAADALGVDIETNPYLNIEFVRYA